MAAWHTSRAAWIWEGSIQNSSVYIRIDLHGAEYQGNIHVHDSAVEAIGIRDLTFDPATDSLTGIARVFAYVSEGETCVEREDLAVRFSRHRK